MLSLVTMKAPSVFPATKLSFFGGKQGQIVHKFSSPDHHFLLFNVYFYLDYQFFVHRQSATLIPAFQDPDDGALVFFLNNVIFVT